MSGQPPPAPTLRCLLLGELDTRDVPPGSDLRGLPASGQGRRLYSYLLWDTDGHREIKLSVLADSQLEAQRLAIRMAQGTA